jgi:hypothetical protein
MLRSSKVLLVVCGLLVAAGCQRKSTTNPDPCADGGCQVDTCEFGSCDFEFNPRNSTISSNSPRAGTFAEGASASCPYDPAELPPMEVLLDDSVVPEFKRGRSRGANNTQGGSFLQDHEIHSHMLGYQGQLFDCLDMAACYSEEELGDGELDFEFELEPNGRVSAVSVRTSEKFSSPVVLACARKSLYEFRFPSYKGARMVVSYSLQISATSGF